MSDEQLKIFLDATIRLTEAKLKLVGHLDIGNFSSEILFKLISHYEMATREQTELEIVRNLYPKIVDPYLEVNHE